MEQVWKLYFLSFAQVPDTIRAGLSSAKAQQHQSSVLTPGADHSHDAGRKSGSVAVPGQAHTNSTFPAGSTNTASKFPSQAVAPGVSNNAQSVGRPTTQPQKPSQSHNVGVAGAPGATALKPTNTATGTSHYQGHNAGNAPIQTGTLPESHDASNHYARSALPSGKVAAGAAHPTPNYGTASQTSSTYPAVPTYPSASSVGQHGATQYSSAGGGQGLHANVGNASHAYGGPHGGAQPGVGGVSSSTVGQHVGAGAGQALHNPGGNLPNPHSEHPLECNALALSFTGISRASTTVKKLQL